MSSPAYARTWTQNLTSGRPGTRIAYTSVLGVMQQYLYDVTNWLSSNGLTIQFSSDSVIAGAGNNIAAPANWVRGVNATTAQSWMILLDGNGGQLLVAYTGPASDDQGYISYSPGALFAGTGSTLRPTATDEIVLRNGATLVGADASGDRVWHGLVSADGKAYRFSIFRLGVRVLSYWAVESYTPVATPNGVSLTPPVICYGTGGTLSGIAAFSIGQLRAKISSISYLVNPVYILAESSGLQVRTETAGLLGWIAQPANLYATQTADAYGWYGTAIDTYMLAPTQPSFDDKNFLTDGNKWWAFVPMLWPNPSRAVPMVY